MDLQVIIPIAGLILGWLGFMEKRLNTMMKEVERKIKDSNRLNEVIQLNLKEDIARMEQKIDMLIQLQIMGHKNEANKS